jgi:F0F1-type ATP synthase delta subunit
MTEQYAQAIWNLAHEEGADIKSIVKRVEAHLTESGRLKLLPQILIALKKIEARQTKVTSMVEVASEHEAPAALKAAAAHGIHATKAVINDSLISGWRATGSVEGKGKLIDNSAKRELLELYQAVTK